MITKQSSPGVRLALDERLARCAQLIIRARIFFDIWRSLRDATMQPSLLDCMNDFPQFFRFAPEAHFAAFVVHIVSMFDRTKETISLHHLREEVKASCPTTLQSTAEIDELFARVASLVKKTVILRNNLFAHRSATADYSAYFKRADVTPNQLVELTEIALEIANRLLEARGLSPQYFDTLASRHTIAMLEALGRPNWPDVDSEMA